MDPDPKIITIVIIDDHPIYRQGLVHTLNAEADFDVVGEGECASDAVRIAANLTPDLLLLDISMPGGGIEAAEMVAEASPSINIVMLTVSESEEHVSKTMRLGCSGYILKGISGPDLVRTVREIHLGSNYVSPGLAAQLLSQNNRSLSASSKTTNLLEELSHREQQILDLVALGQSNKEVANQLELSEKTVKHYMTSIMQKLNVRNRVEATLIAQGQNIK